MAHESPKRIRNVALVGHRGSGKTSVNEALLFEAGAINRLGSVAEGSTISDSAPDEKARQMSISASLSSFRWEDRKINLIDTPGDPSFVADALAALRVVEGAVFVVNGVMGAEVTTTRLWERATELGLARILFVNMLDRERADFFRSLESLKSTFGQHVVATEIPIGAEHELEGVVDLIDMKAYRYDGAERDNCTEIEIPEHLADQAQEYREKLMDEVAEVSDALMERYLEGEEISHDETVSALKTGVTEGHVFPVTCGAATRNLGINRLLDALVDDLPSPAKRGAIDLDGVMLEPDESKDMVAFVFKTLADPYAGRVNLFRVYQGVLGHDSHVFNCRAHVKERIGQLLVPQGKENEHADEFGPGDIGAVAKLKETRAGDVLAGKDAEIPLALPAMPRPVMAFAIEAKAKGDEEKMGQALRRLQEEDPTIDFHRDTQTGEQILAGISQIHVEVIVERMRERFGAEVELHPPHVPYREAIRSSAKAHARYKKQTGGRGQFADCHIEIEPVEQGSGFEFVNAIKGGVIPGGFIPAVEKGVAGGHAQRNRRRLPGARRAGDRVRRPAPLRRLVGDGLQDRRLDGLQGRDGERPAHADGADHDRGRDRARGVGGRCDRRPQLPARPATRHGAQRLGDRGQGRGADGRAPGVCAGPARHHRRPGGVHDGARPLRAGARTRGPAGGGAGPAGEGGREGLVGAPIIGPVKKELRPVHDVVNCDVCGRTILKGERAEWYLAPGGARHRVCDLCAVRAQHHGWIRESAAGDLPARMPRNEPGRGVFGRLRRRRPAESPRASEEAAPRAAPRKTPTRPASTSRRTRPRRPLRASARGPGHRIRGTCEPCPAPRRPGSIAPWSCSTAPPTRARSPAWRARSARPG